MVKSENALQFLFSGTVSVISNSLLLMNSANDVRLRTLITKARLEMENFRFFRDFIAKKCWGFYRYELRNMQSISSLAICFSISFPWQFRQFLSSSICKWFSPFFVKKCSNSWILLNLILLVVFLIRFRNALIRWCYRQHAKKATDKWSKCIVPLDWRHEEMWKWYGVPKRVY